MDTKIHNLKYAWLLYLFLFIAVSPVEGDTLAATGAWEPFKARVELESHVGRSIDTDEMLSVRDELTQTDKIIIMDQNPAWRKNENSPNGLRVHNVTISFSRVMMDQMKVDIRQSIGNENEKLNSLKAVPSMFLNSSYRDAFESLGKIFEPQVNLSIEF